MAPEKPKPKRSKNLLGLVLCTLLALAAPFLGILVTALYLQTAFQDTDRTDPSHKAQVLSQGISEAMNGAAAGMLVSLLALIAAVVFAIRLYRERRPARG